MVSRTRVNKKIFTAEKNETKTLRGLNDRIYSRTFDNSRKIAATLRTQEELDNELRYFIGSPDSGEKPTLRTVI